MKKIVSFIMILILSLTMAAGCSKKEEDTSSDDSGSKKKSTATAKTTPTADASDDDADEDRSDEDTANEDAADASNAPASGNFSAYLTGTGFTMGIADGWTDSSYNGYAIATAPDLICNVNVIPETLPTNISLDTYLEAAKTQLDALDDFKNRVELSTDKVKVNTYNAIRYAYKVNIGVEIIIAQYCIIQDKTCYVITYTSLESTNYDLDLAAMLDSFVIE